MDHETFCRNLGLEVPLVSAGMGFVALPELAAAVSQAGALGLMGLSPTPPAEAAERMRRVRGLTRRPYGVSLIVSDSPLGPLCTEQHLEAVLAARPAVVVFHWGFPAREWIARMRDAGIQVWLNAESLAAGIEAAALGASAVIAQGSDAGGHARSRVGLISLVPALADAVAPLPVVAAGGIGDGRGVAAALALGASAACLGTRFLVACEANAHERYQHEVLESTCDDVVRTTVFGPEWPDQPVNVIGNRATSSDPGADPVGETTLFGEPYVMPPRSAILPTRETRGDFERMCMPAGRGVGLVRRVEPAADIVRALVEEMRHALCQGALRSELACEL